MLKLNNTEVMNMDNALRGMRNPMKSWDKSDSYWTHIADSETHETANYEFFVGDNDLRLARNLRNAGSDHRKYLRQIFVSVDITAPLYWWKEFDTYKIGTVANSESTMHTIHRKPFERDDFSHDRMSNHALAVLDYTILNLNLFREQYLESNNKSHWDDMIQILPSSYNQMRTVTLNYEVLINIYFARRNHKLDEWHTFCEWIESLPYAEELVL